MLTADNVRVRHAIYTKGSPLIIKCFQHMYLFRVVYDTCVLIENNIILAMLLLEMCKRCQTGIYVGE